MPRHRVFCSPVNKIPPSNLRPRISASRIVFCQINQSPVSADWPAAPDLPCSANPSTTGVERSSFGERPRRARPLPISMERYERLHSRNVPLLRTFVTLFTSELAGANEPANGCDGIPSGFHEGLVRGSSGSLQVSVRFPSGSRQGVQRSVQQTSATPFHAGPRYAIQKTSEVFPRLLI